MINRILFLILVLWCGVSAGYIDTIKSVKSSYIRQILMTKVDAGGVAFDSSGRGYNGSYSGTTITANHDGFDNTTKSVYFGGAGILNMGLDSTKFGGSVDSGTIMYWYKQDDTTNYSTIRFQFGFTMGSSTVISGGYDNTKRWTITNRYDNTNHLNYYYIGKRFERGGWICHIATWNKSQHFIKHYLNGGLLFRDDNFNGTTGNAFTGTIAYYSSRYAKGWFSNIVTWNTSLDSSDIRKLSAPQAVKTGLCYGNSITNGTGASSEFTTYRNKLRDQLNILIMYNSGISSTILQDSTVTNSGLNRWRTSITNNVYRPDIVYILYGTNDAIYEGYQHTYNSTFKSDYLRLIDSLKSNGFADTNIIISTLVTHPTQDNIVNSFNVSINDIATKKHVKLAATYDSTYPYRSTCLSDAVHPNDLGHSLIANAMYNAKFKKKKSTGNNKSSVGVNLGP